MGRPRGREGRADGAGSLPETIATLSRVLPAGPSPETFRRAKFDRPEAAPALWRLLADVLSPSPAPGASLPLEAQVRLAKAALRSQGYPRRALALLPEDGSQGSRELLLALAWLLAHGPLLEQLLERSRLRLGDELCVCQCEDPASPGLPTPCVDADGRVDIRQLQWLMGKLRFRWRSLFSMQQEQCALLAKIHSYTRGCHGDRILGHLSVVETELLRNPRHGQQLLRSLEQENVRLEAAVAWRRHQLVFWQWADTVLRTCPPDSPRPRIPTQGTGELELLSQELRALHEELQDVAESRRAAWEARRCCRLTPGSMSGITSGGAQGTLWDAGAQTLGSHVQGKHCTPLYCCSDPRFVSCLLLVLFLFGSHTRRCSGFTCGSVPRD
ncbi:tubulin epsilon and delta complex protein 1 isoform X4 [Sorex araneus]|uniref:tubulin epsilon and delta complex protein 1 isoform X4 n=1 Tax=Sorex araneus TaxID=42254 RepID=UPI0024333702|nr:tubulin epsilon and delta complex protein 1 isoform X4 [Sorex araneus]